MPKIAGLIRQGDGKAREFDVQHYGAVGNGSTSDHAAIQAAINAAVASGTGAKVIFSGGKTYAVSTTVNIPAGADGLELIGEHGARLKWTGSSGTGGLVKYMVDHSVTTRFSNITMTVNVTGGATTVTIPTANAAQLTVGDYLLITTTKKNNNNSTYTLGTYRRVTEVNTGTGVVTLDGPCGDSLSTSTDAPKVNAYAATNNIVVRDLTFQVTSANVDCGGLNLIHCYRPRIYNCHFIGDKSVHLGVGVGVQGTEIRVRDCTATGWIDPDNGTGTGYGILVVGHDVQVEGCNVSYCKHGIAGGNSSFRTFGTVYRNNVGQSALLDTHGNCDDVLYEGNYMYDVGLYTDFGRDGMHCSGSRVKIINNTVVGAATQAGTTTGILLATLATENIIVEGNTIRNVNYGIKHYDLSGLTDITVRNTVYARNNMFGILTYGILLKQHESCVIEGNNIRSNTYGIAVDTIGKNILIKGNNIWYGATTNGHGVQIGGVAGTTGTGWSVIGNQFVGVSSVASHAIRVLRYVDKLVAIGNFSDLTAAAVGATTVHIASATELQTANTINVNNQPA
jgi:parallel beta-helix repeat protein